MTELDISVLMTTYNRADILRETLEAMCAVRRDGLRVELVVVDNNSSDHTPAVIEAFTGRLPLRHVFEPRPGKNCALNRALDDVKLGALVVFADDDVTPDREWLVAIAAASARHPEWSVFGGRIRAQWPLSPVPSWAQAFAPHYGEHHWSPEDAVYPAGVYPFGANYWVRSSVFALGVRFNEQVGPRPKNRLMGSETTFILALIERGYDKMHCPFAVVSHRVAADAVTLDWLRQRVFRLGRSSVHSRQATRDKELLRDRPARWYGKTTARAAYYSARYASARCLLSGDRAVQEEVRWLTLLGRTVESLRCAQHTRARMLGG